MIGNGLCDPGRMSGVPCFQGAACKRCPPSGPAAAEVVLERWFAVRACAWGRGEF